MLNRNEPDNTRPLLLSWGLNTVFTIVELFIGFASGSLALIADGMRNLTDSVTLTIAFVAERYSKKQSDGMRTFGYGRVKIIASLLNTGILFSVAMYIFIHALSRFNEPRILSGSTIALVAVAGAIVNGLAAMLLHKHRKDLNIGSTYTGLLYGSIGSIGILIAGILIAVFKQYWIDDVAGMVIAVMLLVATFKLTRDATHILLEGVPTSIPIDQVKIMLGELDGVTALEEVHAWTIDHEDYAFSCHLIMDSSASSGYSTAAQAKEILQRKYGFTHTTIEIRLV